ncbi:peptidoglycan DD-metalloendopeptidase family protein [Streptomyces sp. NPDC059524]|uniref:peptidoglycan DD-metalloendopeptidase family protein n=1 Tax=Streptomyces sp. NPDC059524 TaxID=3346856 RepID=UPI0036BF9F54
MNDRHPSGTAHDATYDGYSTTSFATDPLFGDLAGTDPYDTGSYGHVQDSGQWYGADGQHQQQQYAQAADPYATSSYETHGTGGYDTSGLWTDTGYGQQQTGQWDTQSYTGHTGFDGTSEFGTQTFDASGFQHPGYDSTSAGFPAATADYTDYAATTSTFDASAYETSSFETSSFETSSFEAPGFDAANFETGSFPGAGHETPAHGTATFDAPGFETSGFDSAGLDSAGFDHSTLLGTTSYDTGAYDATAWNSAGTETRTAQAAPSAQDTLHAHVPDQYVPEDAYDAADSLATSPAPAPADAEQDDATDAGDTAGGEEQPNPWEPELARAAAPRSAPRGRAAARRRTPAKRSALLTVAVPSVCAIGVAGVAAASVGGLGGEEPKETKAAAAPDVKTVKPSVANNKLDTQLRGLSADAGDFADRASRTQERIDLKAKQEADRKKAAEEAARKEAARPKFALPVSARGLSAYFGQAGINWMSSHTGIDFPVSYVPVMAATDGTVRTQWNSAYGNMAIVTAKDGTETWYCHLSRHTVLSGPVKAGDVIATSGDSGNSTGPHLHFEVHPGGGAAVDPLPWLRSHGLDPT